MSDLKTDLASLRIGDSGGLTSKRRRRWPWAAAVVVLVVGYVGWRSVSAAVEVDTIAPTVETGANLTAGSPVLTASGYVVARRRAVVSAKIQGRLQTLLVEEGSRVQEGEVFARLESADFQAALTRARAELQRAEAQISGARAQIISAEAGITRAEADQAEAERQLAVTQRLSNDKLVPSDQLDAVASKVKVAMATVGQMRAELARARADIERTVAERAQAAAGVGYNEALLQNTVIRAPFTGTVVKKMAEVGESVAPIPPGVNISTASGAIVALADLDTLEVEVDVAEANVARLQLQQPAEVIVEAFNDRKYKGVLRQVIPTADRTRATVMVKVTILDKDAGLKPEMSAKVTFIQPAASANAEIQRLMMVPQAAVVTADGKSRVFTIVDGVAHAKDVQLGAQRQDRVVVVSGLDGKEMLIAKPPASLKAGGSRAREELAVAAVVIDHVRKIYQRDAQEIVVLDGLTLEVPEAEFVALMGPSGSGKTTLLNLIAGIDRPSSGRVVVAGTEVSALSEAQLAKWRSRHVGFIFQFYNLIPVLTALENVELPLLLTNLTKRERRERALTALRVVGLADRAKHYPRQLSGGQEQRVAIARAIVTDPVVLVADEPTGDLDARSAEDILDLMQTLNEDFGKTIVMVTHDPRAARRAHTERHLDKGVLKEVVERPAASSRLAPSLSAS